MGADTLFQRQDNGPAREPGRKLAAVQVDPEVRAGVARRRQRLLLYRSTLRALARVIDMTCAFAVVWLMTAAAGMDLLQAPLVLALPCLAAPLAAAWGLHVAGGYRFNYAGSIPGHLARVAVGGFGGLGALLATALLLGAPASEGTLLIKLCLGVGLALFSLHANYLGIARVLTRNGKLSDNVVIIGATEAASRIIARNEHERELNVLGWFDDRVLRDPPPMGEARYLGGVEDLMTWPRLPEVDRIVVTVTSTAQSRVNGLIAKLRTLPQEIILVLDLDGFAPEQTSLARVVDAPAAYISGAPRDLRRAIVKRASDIVIAGLMLAAFAPLMLIIAALIKLDSPGPVFFRQKRHGFNNEIIRVWKFRSMRPDRRAEEGLIRQTEADDPRITRIGRFLRQSSLDEVPQLLNVLAGEMSLVGPRPHAIGMTAEQIEVHRIVGDYAHRHRMKPGLTGWAQINGSRGPVHTTEGVRERVRLDMDYVRRASLWLDLYIIAMTAPRLLGDANKAR